MFPIDNGDIPETSTFVTTKTCTEVHPGARASRDAKQYPPIEWLAKKIHEMIKKSDAGRMHALYAEFTTGLEISMDHTNYFKISFVLGSPKIVVIKWSCLDTGGKELQEMSRAPAEFLPSPLWGVRREILSQATHMMLEEVYGAAKLGLGVAETGNMREKCGSKELVDKLPANTIFQSRSKKNAMKKAGEPLGEPSLVAGTEESVDFARDWLRSMNMGGIEEMLEEKKPKRRTRTLRQGRVVRVGPEPVVLVSDDEEDSDGEGGDRYRQAPNVSLKA